jgi:phosphoesterase RecJ-like protein
MVDFNALSKRVEEKIASASAVTILTHLNPDPDTLGTGLGIYHLLKHYTDKPVEIVNASDTYPRYLDFLPAYQRIKKKIDYTDSLVISCDCGSMDRLGFDLAGREIINIDHHQSNGMYGEINVVVPEYASASQVAYRLFETCYPATPESAACFYTALLSDTQYFTTNSVNREVFRVAEALVGAGAEPAVIAANFTQRRSLASLRILERALHSLELYFEGKVAVLRLSEEDIVATGATIPDIDGIVDYGRSLATVEVALLCMALPDGTLRVSLRSKDADVARVAARFGGGGHKVAAGFTLKNMLMQEIVDTILHEISTLGLIDG